MMQQQLYHKVIQEREQHIKERIEEEMIKLRKFRLLCWICLCFLTNPLSAFPFYDLSLCVKNYNSACNPDSLRVLIEQGHLAFDNKDFNEAIRFSTLGLAFCENGCDSILQMRGLAYAYLKKEKKAFEDFNAALVINPLNFSIHNSMGEAYLLTEEWENAILSYNLFLMHEDSDSLAHFRRGYAYENMGRDSLAIFDYQIVFEKVCERNSKLAYETANRLGRMLYVSGQFKLAVSPLKRSIDLATSEDLVVSKSLGISYFNIGEFDSAIFYLVPSSIAVNRDYEALLYIAMCENALGNIADAYGSLYSLLSECKNSTIKSRAHFFRAIMNVADGYYPEAIDDLNSCKKLYRKNGDYYFYLAFTQVKLEVSHQTVCYHLLKALEFKESNNNLEQTIKMKEALCQ